MPTPIAGLAPEPAILLDERTRPDLRDAYGILTRDATQIAVAVTRVRLATLDLRAEELSSVTSLRVLVAELNALTLDAEARLIHSDPRRAPRVALYRGLLESGRLEIRSAPLGGWSPDFSVFSGAEGPSAVLTGFHWFERPYPHRGPAFASIHFGSQVAAAANRHAELWARAHDVGPAVWNILSKAERSARLRDIMSS
jgi:hypothetical protein